MDADAFLWSWIFGAIGGGYLAFGKILEKPMLMILGGLMLAASWLIYDPTTLLLTGCALTLAPFFLK